MKLVLTPLNIKEEFRHLKTSQLHLSHFNLVNWDTKMSANIDYVDKKGYVINLKKRGCIQSKTFKQVVRRKLKFDKL